MKQIEIKLKRLIFYLERTGRPPKVRVVYSTENVK